MFTNLSFFIDDCLRAENDKSIFVIDKKKGFIDLVIAFLIVIITFTIVGFLFNVLNSIHYLFYMFFVSINVAYSVSLYLGVRTNICKKKLKISIFHALFMRIMVIINLTSLMGVVLSFLVYQPFLGIINQIIFLLFSISTSIFLVLRAYHSSVKHHDIQNILLTIIILTPMYILIMYLLSTSILALTIVVPTMIVILLFVVKHYLMPPIRLRESFRIPVVVVSTFVFTASIFYVFGESNVYRTQDNTALGLYYYHLIEEEVCQINQSSTRGGMMMNGGSYFFQSGNTIQVYNSKCSLVEVLDVQYPFTIFELEGEVSVLSHSNVTDDLEEDYKAYNLYIFDGQSFVQDRVIYQYGSVPSELFIYNGHLSYKLNHDYYIVNDHYIPYIKSFEDDSKYGTDIRISTDIVHYQDDQRLIFQGNGLEVLSRPTYNSSIVYSNGYILKFVTDYFSIGSGDIDTSRPVILSVESQLNNSQEYQVVLSKIDLGIASNYVEGFHYINQYFYIYVNQTIFIYNQDGKLIDEIKRIPNDYQFVEEELYILSQSNLGAITKIDLNHASEYLPKEHVYIQNGYYDAIESTNTLYKYNIHTYSIVINYLIIIYLGALIMIRVEYKKL